MPPDGDTTRRDVTRIALLGLNAWAVALAIPVLHAAGGSTAARVAALLGPLVALALGVLALRGGHRAAPSALLVGFPTALALALGTRAELHGADGHTPLTLVAATLSFVAWGAAAARAVGRPPRTRVATREPLGPRAEAVPGSGRRTAARRALLGITALGALAIVSVAPTLTGGGDAERAWGDAAAEGALLATVTGGALATLVLALFVGPALRAPRGPRGTRPSLLRAGLAVVAFATGIAAWVVYARLR